MGKIIYKISIIFILLITVLNGSVYALPKYGSAGSFWPKVVREAYNDLGYKDKEYNAKKMEEYATKINKKVFDKIKSYSKTKLEKLLDDCKDAEHTYTSVARPGGSEYANTLISMANDKLRSTTIPKLIKGEYDKKTNSSDTENVTAEGYKESKEENYDEDTKVEGSTFEDEDDNTVGDLPKRKLGLITDQKEESVKETSPDTIVNSADDFLKVGKEDEIDEESLNNVSNTVYNILLAVAIALAVIIGIVLGIKFMTSGAEGQAKIKEALIPYIVGCLVAFSAFGIWKLIIIILNNV